MGDLTLPLKDRAHYRRQVPVDHHGILELVDDERDALALAVSNLAGQSEGSLKSGEDVLLCECRLERDGGHLASSDLDLDVRLNPPQQLESLVIGAGKRPGKITVNDRGDGIGQVFEAGDAEQVEGCGEDPLAPELAGGLLDQGRLPKAPRRDDHHVLPAADIGLETLKLSGAISEVLLLDDVAVAKRVQLGHAGG